MVFEGLNAKLSSWAYYMIYSLGYIGIFIVNLVCSSSIIFPLPAFAAVPVAAAIPGMNPWLVGISAGLGAAMGEATGYGLGRGGIKVINKKYENKVKKYKKFFTRDNLFFWIVIFAATPLPSDIVGLVCGLFKYDFKKFIVASIIGKCIMNLFLAFGGFYTIPWIIKHITPWITSVLVPWINSIFV